MPIHALLWLQKSFSSNTYLCIFELLLISLSSRPTVLCATAEPHVHSTTTVRTQVQCHGLLVKRFPQQNKLGTMHVTRSADSFSLCKSLATEIHATTLLFTALHQVYV